MTAKLKFPTEFPTPISEDINYLLLACGYEISFTAPFQIEYEALNRRLTFEGYGFKYEEMFGSKWNATQTFDSSRPITSLQMMELLQAAGAIDYTKIPSFKRMMREIKEMISNQNEKICKQQLSAHSLSTPTSAL